MGRLRAAVLRWLFDRLADAGEPVEVNVDLSRDWISDPALSVAEKMRRFEALHPEPTHGPGQPWIRVQPTQTSGSGGSVTYRWNG